MTQYDDHGHATDKSFENDTRLSTNQGNRMGKYDLNLLENQDILSCIKERLKVTNFLLAAILGAIVLVAFLAF